MDKYKDFLWVDSQYDLLQVLTEGATSVSNSNYFPIWKCCDYLYIPNK